MVVRRDPQVARHRQEHEGVLAGESPLVDDSLDALLAGARSASSMLSGRRGVGVEGVSRLGDGPAAALALMTSTLIQRRAGQISRRAEISPSPIDACMSADRELATGLEDGR